jgi:nucleoside-diphosphate-sugar epimerase
MAQKDLDFKPAYELQQGLQEALEWYKFNKWL